MELGLVLTLCGLGFVLWVPALIIGTIWRNKSHNCTADTIAAVTRINTRHSSDIGMEFHPVYEYYVGGCVYTSEGAYVSHRVPNVGDRIQIKYNPSNPAQSYIPGYDGKAFQIVTIVFGIFGSVPVLVCIGIALYSCLR